MNWNKWSRYKCWTAFKKVITKFKAPLSALSFLCSILPQTGLILLAISFKWKEESMPFFLTLWFKYKFLYISPLLFPFKRHPGTIPYLSCPDQGTYHFIFTSIKNFRSTKIQKLFIDQFLHGTKSRIPAAPYSRVTRLYDNKSYPSYFKKC